MNYSTSPRRTGQVRALSYFAFALSLVWFFVVRNLGLEALSIYILGAALLFLAVPTIGKKNFLLARIILVLAFNLSVTATASFVGPGGRTEFVLLFTFGLPFLTFSYLRERAWIILFAFLPLNEWLALYLTDFNLFSDTHVSDEVANAVFYPLSVISTFALVGFQIAYFASLNSNYSARMHQRRIEAEEASTAKTRFLSTMSHEIRTPLNAIIGLSYILHDTKLRDDQKEQVEALNYSAKLLLELLNTILDYSKMDAQKLMLDPMPTDICKEISQLHAIHEPNCLKKNISFKIDCPSTMPRVRIDEIRFTQVLNNLINNAIKFTDEGGITVTVEQKDIAEDKTLLSVAVSDTGIGISEDKLNAVFEAFQQETDSTQRLYGGTGLGLSIAQKIIQEMGGQIQVKSMLGSGTTFYFDLELDKVTATEVEESKQKIDYDMSGVKALLVEDNPINEMVGRQILENVGMDIDSAENGAIAEDMVKHNTYDIVFMDIQMPVMDGYEASQAIREFDTSLPIIALSASVLMEVKDLIYQCGMDGFIQKPFDPNNLFEEVQRVLEEGRVPVV